MFAKLYYRGFVEEYEYHVSYHISLMQIANYCHTTNYAAIKNGIHSSPLSHILIKTFQLPPLNHLKEIQRASFLLHPSTHFLCLRPVTGLLFSCS